VIKNGASNGAPQRKVRADGAIQISVSDFVAAGQLDRSHIEGEAAD
jgi:hypothetical protein